MEYIGIASGVIAFATGLISAFYWYKSSSVPIIPPWADNPLLEPLESDQKQMAWLGAMLQTSERVNDYNKIAARWSAITAAVTCVPYLAKPFGL